MTTNAAWIGLPPMFLETRIQAQFLIPMTVSLAFGILFVSTLILLFLPAALTFGQYSSTNHAHT